MAPFFQPKFPWKQKRLLDSSSESIQYFLSTQIYIHPLNLRSSSNLWIIMQEYNILSFTINEEDGVKHRQTELIFLVIMCICGLGE